MIPAAPWPWDHGDRGDLFPWRSRQSSVRAVQQSDYADVERIVSVRQLNLVSLWKYNECTWLLHEHINHIVVYGESDRNPWLGRIKSQNLNLWPTLWMMCVWYAWKSIGSLTMYTKILYLPWCKPMFTRCLQPSKRWYKTVYAFILFPHLENKTKRQLVKDANRLKAASIRLNMICLWDDVEDFSFLLVYLFMYF